MAGPPEGDGALDELEAPLLRTSSSSGVEDGKRHASNFAACTFNLTKAVFGAGMMCLLLLSRSLLGAVALLAWYWALPRACGVLGVYCSFGMLGVVALLTWYSISRGMVHPTAAKLQGTRRPMYDYSGLVRAYLGHSPVQLLNAFILLNGIGFAVMCLDVMADELLGPPENPGFLVDLYRALDLPAALVAWLVMYLDVMADVLLGQPQNPGVLVDLYRAFGLSAALVAWLSYRPLFLALFTALVIAPLSMQRDIASLRSLSALGLAALALLALALGWLAGRAYLQGTAHALPLWPNAAMLGVLSASGGSRLLAGLSLLPVVLASDGCHMNVMPLAAMMAPFSRRSMDSVVATTMVVCTAFYALFSGAAYTAFGPEVDEDLLKNMNPQAMAPTLGLTQAYWVAYIVRITYTLSLLGSAALNNFPIRDAMLDVVYAKDSGAKAVAREKHFVAVTAFILFLVCSLAILVPSIWTVIGFVGAIASTGVCYFFPAAMMFAYSHSLEAGRTLLQAGAAVVFLVGLFIAVNGLLTPM